MSYISYFSFFIMGYDLQKSLIYHIWPFWGITCMLQMPQNVYFSKKHRNPLWWYLGYPFSKLWRLGRSCVYKIWFLSTINDRQKRVLLTKMNHLCQKMLTHTKLTHKTQFEHQSIFIIFFWYVGVYEKIYKLIWILLLQNNN